MYRSSKHLSKANNQQYRPFILSIICPAAITDTVQNKTKNKARNRTVTAITEITPTPLNWHKHWHIDDFLAECKAHGVSALVAHYAEQSALTLPTALSAELTQITNAHKVTELLHKDALKTVITTLATQQIEFILLKGTAHAYSLYPAPYLRSRTDTDLLIAENQKQQVNEILTKLDFEILYESAATVNSYQRCYQYTDKLGCQHRFDIHWQLSNRQFFANQLPWQELIQNVAGIEQLGHLTSTLQPPYQMLHACIHRVAHLHSVYDVDEINIKGDRLIWLYDIFLLARRFSAQDWQQLVELAQKKAICCLIIDTLDAVSECFPAQSLLPNKARKILTLQATGEKSVLLLSQGRFKPTLHDFLMLGNRQRLQLLKEKILPSARFLLYKYDKQSALWLPCLYLMHWSGGLKKYLLPNL
ncbi:MAG: nucleotidyltransferase family protein [Pseudomonadales bacterium]|nr:nucleotidyltransferase family protein [Pseudomonadales bacterium]